MRCVELFAGVGGFRVALERAGHEVVWANEWDKYACDVYDYNFSSPVSIPDRRSKAGSTASDDRGQGYDPLVKNGTDATARWDMRNANGSPERQFSATNPRGHRITRGDITKVAAEDIPAHDLLVGGFPCQAFSVAGKRRGFEETRGTLFFDIMRIATHHRTPYLLLENVKGLLNHEGGRTFETILRSLDEHGYDCQWQVLNSKDFGVPQNRERIIIVGHLRGRSRPQVFPLGESGSFDFAQAEDQQARDNLIQLAIPEATRKGYALATVGDSINLQQPNSKTRRGRVGKGVAQTIDTSMHQHTIVPEVGTIDNGGLKQIGNIYDEVTNPQAGRVYDPSGLNPAVRRGSGYPNAQVLDGYRIRRLTPRECERLQAFPDDWTRYGLREYGTSYEMSDTQRYKQMGNAVTTNVLYEVARRLPII